MNPAIKTQFSKRFADLETEGRRVSYPADEDWHKWSTQVMQLLEQTFGKEFRDHRKFTEMQDYPAWSELLRAALVR